MDKSGSSCRFEMILRLLLLHLSCAMLYKSDVFSRVGCRKEDFEERRRLVEGYEHFIPSRAVDLRRRVLMPVTVFANARDSPG